MSPWNSIAMVRLLLPQSVLSVPRKRATSRKLLRYFEDTVSPKRRRGYWTPIASWFSFQFKHLRGLTILRHVYERTGAKVREGDRRSALQLSQNRFKSRDDVAAPI